MPENRYHMTMHAHGVYAYQYKQDAGCLLCSKYYLYYKYEWCTSLKKEPILLSKPLYLGEDHDGSRAYPGKIEHKDGIHSEYNDSLLQINRYV